MKTTIKGLCLAALLCLPATAVHAQEIVRAGDLTLAGYRASCGPVQTVLMDMYDIAEARDGRIFLNLRLLQHPRAQQMFWYTHECAHHIFGGGEARADCWSVQQGRIQGWLTRADFDVLATAMAKHPGDATHAAGPARVAAMRACYIRTHIV